MRPTDADDLKYFYAAWRLHNLSFPLAIEGDSSPDAFRKALSDYVAQRFQLSYTLLAKPPGKELMPVGVLFGVLPLPYVKVAWIGDFTWFPWATSRNKLEAAVHFVNKMRKEWTLIGFTDIKETAFAERICRYGVSRRVGTLFDLDDAHPGPVVVFQSRKPYKG